MSYEKKIEFTKANIDFYLKEVAKEYRKQVGKNMPAEMILIGGASVLLNYGFRDMTTDIDALIRAASAMKDAIRNVGNRFNLSPGWLNSDFRYTKSYTPKLVEFSVYYKTFYNVLTVRTISSEYLIAMKLRAGRQYKNDLSDILGILAEHDKQGKPITMDKIQKAVTDLYGGWDSLSDGSREFIENTLENGHYEQKYKEAIKREKDTKEFLIHFQETYPGIMKENNIDKIIEDHQKRTNIASMHESKEIITDKEEKVKIKNDGDIDM